MPFLPFLWHTVVLSMSCMLFSLPVDIFGENILRHLRVRDLQALDCAVSNKSLRPQFRHMLKSFHYTTPHNSTLSFAALQWLHHVGVIILGLNMVDIYRHILIFIFKHCPELKTLRGCVRSGVYDLIPDLAVGCPNIEVFDMSSTFLPLLPNSSYINVCVAGIEALGQLCKHLHTINLLIPGISDVAIRILCDNCPKLRSINISNREALTDNSLVAIARAYPDLQSINMRGCKFSDKGLVEFASCCQMLRSVAVSGPNITSSGLAALWATNPNLTDVNISCNRFIADDDIMILLQCCPQLQLINMSVCSSITNFSICSLAEMYPQITSLDISYNTNISDDALLAIGQHCHGLKSIVLTKLENVSDVGILGLVAGCPLLQEFRARGTKLSYATLIGLARHCGNLQKIFMTADGAVGINGLTAIAEKCPLLQGLNILSYNITDVLYMVGRHCSNLITMRIQYSDAFDVSVVRLVFDSCKYLTKLVLCSFDVPIDKVHSVLGQLQNDYDAKMTKYGIISVERDLS